MASTMGWRPTRAGFIYVIIAIILAASVFGVAWFVMQRGEQVRQQEAAEVAKENLENQTDTPVIAEETENPAPETPGTGTTDGEEVAVTDPNTGGTQTEGTPITPPAGNTTEELPVTGSASTIVSLLAIAGLTYAVSLYIVSRRTARQL